MTLPILQIYTESTDGSNIEAKDSALVRLGGPFPCFFALIGFRDFAMDP